MKIASALMLALAATVNAGTVTKVRDNGPDTNRLVIAIVSDGYTAAQEARFVTDADATLADFFATAPWSSYAGHANVYTDFVASNESGADKPSACYAPEVLKDTAFDATFCGGGTQRLLLVNFGDVLTEINTVLPQADLIGVLVNDPEYGGAGGPVLTFSAHAGARSELFLHEHGHTFAQLADEYTSPYPGYPPGDWEPNVDFDSVRGRVDWDAWIDAATPLPTPGGSAGVGCFEGARYLTTGIYRPVNDCKMRSLNARFCPVCSEAIVQSIYAVVSPLDGSSPAADTVAYDACDPVLTVDLSVTPLLPMTPSWMTASWEMDGLVLPETGFSLRLPASDLAGGSRTVTCTVRDETTLVRRAFLDPMTATRTWTIDPLASDRDADGVADCVDCAPDDATATAPPSAEIALLRVDAPARLSWPADAFTHDVARGLISVLRSTRGYGGSCLPAADSLDDAALPGVGDAFWYLVRSSNACGAGPWGSDSRGAPRAISACP